MEALVALAVMLLLLLGVVHFMTYMELKRFVDHMCKPMPMMVQPPPQAYAPPPPSSYKEPRYEDEDKEPLGFRPPKKKDTKTDEN